MSNYISGSVSDEAKNGIITKINELQAALPITIDLSKNQKSGMTRMDDGRLPFTEKSLLYGQQNPKIAPAYLDFQEMSDDIKLYKAYLEIEKKLLTTLEIIQNVKIAAGTDAYTTALTIYRSAQGAAKEGVQGSQAIVDDLKRLFEGQGNFTKTDEGTTATK